MAKKLAFLFLFLIPLSTYGGEVTVQACASAVVTSESSPGAVRFSSGIGGTGESCIDLNLKSPAETSEYYGPFYNKSDKQTLYFDWGGCNLSPSEVSYTMEHRLNYSIQISTEGDETASAHISYDVADQDFTQGTGSHVVEYSGVLPANVCADGIPVLLIASANVAREYDGWDFRLRNEQGVNGLFYDPGNPGHGFDFNVNKEGMTVFYYGHTSDGERLWLISEALNQKIDYYQPLTFNMFEIAEGSLGSPVPVETLWGTLTVTLDDCDSGFAELQGIDGTIGMSFQRLAGLSDLGCN